MSEVKFTPKLLPDEEIRLAKELCVKMGECAATYHIVIQLGEIERLRAINADMFSALEGWQDHLAKSLNCMDAKERALFFAGRRALSKAVSK